jgi:hypothetical protein
MAIINAYAQLLNPETVPIYTRIFIVVIIIFIAVIIIFIIISTALGGCWILQ